MMRIKATEFVVEVPAGKYFMGDPCYAVPDKEWIPLLESCDYFNSTPIGKMSDGREVLGFSTAYGDGTYHDQYGNEFGVDAGMIGLVPVTEKEIKKNKQLVELGTIIDVKFPMTCSCRNGFLTFGKYCIDTN